MERIHQEDWHTKVTWPVSDHANCNLHLLVTLAITSWKLCLGKIFQKRTLWRAKSPPTHRTLWSNNNPRLRLTPDKPWDMGLKDSASMTSLEVSKERWGGGRICSGHRTSRGCQKTRWLTELDDKTTGQSSGLWSAALGFAFHSSAVRIILASPFLGCYHEGPHTLVHFLIFACFVCLFCVRYICSCICVHTCAGACSHVWRPEVGFGYLC